MRILVGHTNQMPELMLRRPLPGREAKGDQILAFGNGYVQVRHTPGMDWNTLLANCPAGWTPDVYIHWSPEYNAIPKGLEEANCLTVGAFGDWNLGGRAIHAVGGVFDALFADRNGGERLRRAGFEQVFYSPLWAFDPQTHRRLPNSTRDLDIVMVGSFNHAVQWERSKWLARVARLSQRYNVVVTGGVYGEEYVRLMNRAKIVFNRSIRGELNMRTFEATACGALLFYERENPEIRDLFADREECILYGDDDLEDLFAYYLAPENALERERIANTGWRRVHSHSNAYHFADFLNQVEPLVEAKRAGNLPPRRFCALPSDERLLRRATHWFLSVNRETYVALDSELAAGCDELKFIARGPSASCPSDTTMCEAKTFSDSINKDTTSTTIKLSDKAQTEQLGVSEGPPAMNFSSSHAMGFIFSPRNNIAHFRAVLMAESAYRVPPSETRDATFAEAIMQIRAVLEAEPDFALARRNLGAMLLAAGETEAGEKELRNAADLLEQPELTARQLRGPSFPRDFDAFNVRTEQVWNDFLPETDAWRDALRDVLLGHIYGTLAGMAFQKTAYQEATRYAERAITLWPGHGEFRFLLALGLRAQGRAEEAVAAYRDTINEAPFLLEAWKECVLLCLDLSRFEEAFALLDEIGAILAGSPFYGAARPEFDRIRHYAQETARQDGASGKITRLLAFPNWRNPDDWQAVVQEFAEMHAPNEPVLLMLRAAPETAPAAQEILPHLQMFLTQTLGFAPNALPNITLLNQPLAAEDRWKLYRIANTVLVTPDSVGFDPELAEAAGITIHGRRMTNDE